MTTLAKAFAGLDQTRLLIKTPDKQLTVAGLRAASQKLADVLPRGISIALSCYNTVEALVVLVASDGQAGQIALTSPGLDDATRSDLMTVLAPDLVLADLGMASLPYPTVATAQAMTTMAPHLRPRSHNGPTDWVMTTSGTTGTPKLVRHNLLSLTRTTRRNTARAEGQIWGLLYDYTRFAGLQVVLQSMLSGATLVLPDLSATLSDQIQFLAQSGTTHLSATPTLWRKILMTPGHDALPLAQITLGGEIADEHILNMLSKRWPHARISHIFASTEAGVGFSVTDRQPGFPASYLTEPPLDIALQIEDGRLWVRNTVVASHYLGQNGSALGHDGWVDTGDSVDILGGRVYFRGRANGVINVGGNKVHPEEVERVLLSHPQIAMARVYARKNPITGALVAADIVPTADASEIGLQDLILAHARSRLERHMVPALLRIVSNFETSPAGKITRGG